MYGFNRLDRVISYSEYSFGFTGFVRKISNKGIHVIFDNGGFEVFYFAPKHHKQTHIDYLKKKESC